MIRSRLTGAIIGFIAGAAIGVGITFYMGGRGADAWSLNSRVWMAIIVGAIGGLLGGLSGVTKA